MKQIANYQNGNANIELLEDGTRIIQYHKKIKLDYPLNIDIRTSNACPLGLNPKTGKSVCKFCHESATTDGKECNFSELKSILDNLPSGIELAIGGNTLTHNLTDFLMWCKYKGYVCNLTVNHLQVNKFNDTLIYYIDKNLIKGLGISYRKGHELDFNPLFIKYKNTILHTIAGIDDVDDILSLPFNKILVLGYKKFGFGEQFYSQQIEDNIKQWIWWAHKLIDNKKVVSFDNLALQQLNIIRFFTKEHWKEFNQGEHSLYINAVEKYFAPSSRSNLKTNWNNISITDYFKKIDAS